jgi:hypothetical protein
MTKKLTIKEFILYNNPCFICGNKITFYLKCNHNSNPFSVPQNLTSTLKNKELDVTLLLEYKSTLKLKFNILTHEYITNNEIKLNNYLLGKSLFLSSYCDLCNSCINSNYLDFQSNGTTGIIKPIIICSETFIIKTNNSTYILKSSFNDKRTVVSIYTSEFNLLQKANIEIDIPLLPLYKFKTKEKLLEKLKILVTFF